MGGRVATGRTKSKGESGGRAAGLCESGSSKSCAKAKADTKLRAEISSKKKAIRDCVWRLGASKKKGKR